MDIIVTAAGRQALVNAAQTGTAPVVINRIGVGTGKYTASATQTTLVAETKRLPITEGGNAGDNSIHVAYQDASSDSYSIHEIGLFLADGTLFAVTSQQTAILQKTATSTALLVIDIAFTDVDVTNIAFGDVTFTNPAANQANAGVVAIANDEEVIAGTDTQKVVTPASLAKRTATATRIGLVELATDTEGTTGTDTTRAMTPASTKAAIDARAATSTDTLAGTSSSLYITPAAMKTLTSTTARAGLIEIATEAEAKAGTDAARAVTPATMKAVVDAATPAASETGQGLVELATSDEVIAGTDTTRAVTPAGLSARAATANVAGVVRLATASQGTAGTSASLAMTPYASKALVDSYAATADQTVAGTSSTVYVTPAALASRTATDGRAGLVELATTTEATTGTDSTRAVTPAGLKAAITAATPNASASVKGLVELATNAEAIAGSSSSLAVTPAGLKAYFRDVDITSANDIINTEGNGNLSLYPSGNGDYMQARAGTSQIAAARFSDDAPGASLVLYKSRGASVKTSKSVVAGDNVGMINFICDNGNIDYEGSAVGARVAYINADVFESSTIPSGGTTNLGIRGALRFYVCSDANTRTGKGVELLDNTLRPLADDELGLGTSGRRYTNIYSVNGTIQTSDANKKTDIKPIDDKVLDAWGAVAYRQFRMKNDDKAIHIGVIAQQVDEAFKSYGLDARDYGLFCDDKDEDGETILGIRYTEALALECAYQRRMIEKLTMRMGALEGS